MKKTKSFIQYAAMLILFMGISSNVWAAVLGAGESITFIIDDSSAKQSDGWNGGPYFYAWDASNNALTGGWPGTEIGAKKYVFTEGATIPAGVIFRSKYDWGGNTGKTADINDCNGVAFQANYTYTIKLTGSYSGSGENRIFAHTITGVAGSSGGGSTDANLNEPYVISVYKNGWDKQYAFTPVAGSKNYEYEVTVEIPDFTGNLADYQYWVGEGCVCNEAWKDGQSANYNLGSRNNADDDYLTSCSTGTFKAKIYALQENGMPHGEARNYYIHSMTCAEHSAKLSLNSSVREFDLAEPPTSITLTATADEKSEGNFVWYQSTDEGATYTKITETTANTYTLTGSAVPMGARNYFKVARKVVDSEDFVESIVVIYTVQSCGAESKGTNIFRQDFGELTAVKGTGSRSSFSNIVSGYNYQPAPYKINESYYAVVADPYYCGCGEGSDMSELVTDECLGRNAWFRELRDHTLNNTSNKAPYGGMLMINFKEKGIAYQRELTPEEHLKITKNSILKFSAYFASAAKYDPSFIGIDVELIIQFKKNGSTEWEDAIGMESTVSYEEGWQRSEIEWPVKDADGVFRVVIKNNSDSGTGNDLLMDDVSLDLCTPAFALYFADDKGNQFEELEAQKLSETAKVQVKQIDFGSLGANPCIQLFARETSGTTTSYTYVSDLTLSNGYYTSNVAIQDLIQTVPGQVELVAIASAKSGGVCDSDIRTGVENGVYEPGKQNNVIFSGNYLTYSITCGTSSLTNHEGTAKVCVSDANGTELAKMPKLKLTSTNISGLVYFDVYVNNQPFVTQAVYSEETAGCGYMLVDVDQLYYDVNGTYYQWPVGTNVIKIKVSEKFKDASVCERWANGSIAVQVVARPSITTNLVGAEVCQGETTTLSIAASPVTKYQWQTIKPGDADWSNVGTNSASYTTPADMANETQYRVQLYNDNDLLCATTSDVATMSVISCNDMKLTQSADVEKVCLGDEFIYSVSLYNNAAGNANNVYAVVEWDPAVLQLDEETVCVEFNTVTHVWRAGFVFPSKASAGLGLKFKVISNDVADIRIKSYISKLNGDTFNNYDEQTSSQMKGETIVTFNEIADTPQKKRPNELFAYNLCRTGIAGDKVAYDFLIEGTGTGSSLNLIWMDMDYNIIPAEEAYFYSDVPQTDSMYVYNAPDGFCPSDTIKVRYRVKDYTTNPKVKDYIDCVIDGASEELLKTLVINQADYKYLVFKNEEGAEVTTYNPSEPGKNTYYVTAYKEEINTCGSETIPVTVNVKDYAVASHIAAEGAAICPSAEITLSAAEVFDQNQTNVVIRWYSDPNLTAASLLQEGDEYTITNAVEDTYLYVTVETSDFCENQAGDAKEVLVSMKQATPEMEIQPKEQLITIGGMPSFTVSPQFTAETPEYQVYVNDVLVEDITQYKPYVDAVYMVVYEGECGIAADSASVTVQWPTVFTPYQKDGLNDTFVKDMQPNFRTEIFNRFGMPLIATDNGWDGYLTDGKLAMPGVYYYVVTLPDGNVKKGTIEVFKK